MLCRSRLTTVRPRLVLGRILWEATTHLKGSRRKIVRGLREVSQLVPFTFTGQYLFNQGLVEAGSQTSAATLTNLILYLAATPDAQRKAYRELQEVVGGFRAPVYDDLANLPYINACVKEILRLCPAPPWILRHFTDDKVVYKDFVIPKGTAVVANTAAIHFDPIRYPEPFNFKPERYLHHTKRAAEYAATADPNERDHFTFGAGRRICPGSRFAENVLTLALANIIWAFEIKPPLVEEKGGIEVEMDLSEEAFDAAPLKSAKPFRVMFVPRDETRLNVIKVYRKPS
jgi:hypothetical protein